MTVCGHYWLLCMLMGYYGNVFVTAVTLWVMMIIISHHHHLSRVQTFIYK